MSPPEDKLEKVAMVLDRAMRYPKTLRFRQFYARKPSSDEFDEQYLSTQCKGGLYLYFIRVELHTVRDSSQTGRRSGKKTDCRRTIDIGSK